MKPDNRYYHAFIILRGMAEDQRFDPDIRDRIQALASDLQVIAKQYEDTRLSLAQFQQARAMGLQIARSVIDRASQDQAASDAMAKWLSEMVVEDPEMPTDTIAMVTPDQVEFIVVDDGPVEEWPTIQHGEPIDWDDDDPPG